MITRSIRLLQRTKNIQIKIAINESTLNFHDTLSRKYTREFKYFIIFLNYFIPRFFRNDLQYEYFLNFMFMFILINN